jgi:diguanylate cyclase (GGDEF)-like protein
VLLWGADLPTATAVAERMRQRLEASPLDWGGRQHVLTASFGVALPRAHDPEGETGLARADAQLYRAKAQGRNRVRVAQDMAGAA